MVGLVKSNNVDVKGCVLSHITSLGDRRNLFPLRIFDVEVHHIVFLIALILHECILDKLIMLVALYRGKGATFDSV